MESFQFTSASDASRVKRGAINVINCWQDNVNITLGQLTEESGKYAKISLDQAVNDLQHGFIDGLVTAPINKKAMQNTGFEFPGHTEYLTKAFNADESLMLMVNDTLRVGLVTNHIPVSEIASQVTKDTIAKKLNMLHESIKIDFGIDKPKIAVLALNPHASDDGVIGDEEENIIRPVIIEAKKKGMLVMGPFPADGFFGSSQYRKFDGILAMYHDQGLVPFKALSFGHGVNFTAGLPIVRTSPDHGTAYEIAGQNKANHTSFQQALFVALEVAKNRSTYAEMNANPMQKHEAVVEKGDQVDE
jgi:4-hydroxythreonine-4-phosphate dehydrogenase